MNIKNTYFQYQPCYDREGIYGYEALLRIKFNSKVLLPANIINDMNNFEQYYLFNKLLYDISKNNKLQNARVSINISCEFLSNHIFDIRRINSDFIDMSKITIEISEYDEFKDIIAAKINIRQLHDLGFKIAMDDFGSGKSTFLRLASFSFDVVKLDKRLLRNLSGKEIYILNRDILKLNSKLIVICEGVEKKSDFIKLKKAGINYYQGFYFSKPNDLSFL